MSAPPQASKRLQPTGALREDSLYIERASDQDLFDALLASEFCSVLAPRQIGKSSLRVRTARRLSQFGVRCAQIDLTMLGRAADCDPIAAWYFSLASRIADELGLDDPKSFFEQHCGLLAADRFGLYLRRQVLPAQCGPIVIFLDEIDYIRALPVDRDEFFVSIRAFYNERAQQPALSSLTFCLLGVAAPKDLVAKPEITPFNIGRVVHLVDFSRSEIEPFADAVEPLSENRQEWLNEVYRWTAGHPYMTQTLCAKLLTQFHQRRLGATPAESVAQAATSVFLRRGRSEDSNLVYAEKRLDESPLKPELLAVYRQLLEQGHIRYDGGAPVQQELQLCGMAAPADGELKVRNQIFSSVFDMTWLAEKQTQNSLARALRRWHQSGRDSTTLLRGTPLLQVRQWAREHPRDITIDEREFLNICFDTTQQEFDQNQSSHPRLVLKQVFNVALSGTALLGMASMLSWFMRGAGPKLPVEFANKPRHAVSEVKGSTWPAASPKSGVSNTQPFVLGGLPPGSQFSSSLSRPLFPTNAGHSATAASAETEAAAAKPSVVLRPRPVPTAPRSYFMTGVSGYQEKLLQQCAHKELNALSGISNQSIKLERSGALQITEAPPAVYDTNFDYCIRKIFSRADTIIPIPQAVTIRVRGR